MKRLKFTLIFLGLTITSFVFADTRPSPVFAILEDSRWGLEDSGSPSSCQNNGALILFTPKIQYMIQSYDKPVTRDGLEIIEGMAKILAYDDTSITIKYVDETRKTESGEIVVWKLILRDANTFVWHRLDWEEHRFTAPRVRCD